MLSYDHFPDVNSYHKTLKIHPEAAYTHYLLWKLVQKNHKDVFLKKEDCFSKLEISKTTTRKHLLRLKQITVLDFQETPDYFLVSFYV
jgi:hypothetical protein